MQGICSLLLPSAHIKSLSGGLGVPSSNLGAPTNSANNFNDLEQPNFPGGLPSFRWGFTGGAAKKPQQTGALGTSLSELHVSLPVESGFGRNPEAGPGPGASRVCPTVPLTHSARKL